MTTSSNTKFLNGNLVISGEVTVSNHLIPSSNETLDLGSIDNSFKDMYLSGNTVYLGDTILSQQGDALALKDTTGNNIPLITKEIVIVDNETQTTFNIAVNNGIVEISNTGSTAPALSLMVNENQTFGSITTGSIVSTLSNFTTQVSEIVYNDNSDINNLTTGSLVSNNAIFATSNVSSGNILSGSIGELYNTNLTVSNITFSNANMEIASMQNLIADTLDTNDVHMTNNVIDNASIDNSIINNATISSLNADNIFAESGYIQTLITESATLTGASSNDVVSNNVTSGNVNADIVNSTSVITSSIHMSSANITTSTFDTLNINSISTTILNATSSNITNMSIGSVIVNDIIATNQTSSDVSNSQLSSTNINTNVLDNSNSTISNAVFQNSTIQNVVVTSGNASTGILSSDNATIDVLIGTVANISNLITSSITSTNGNITSLNSTLPSVNTSLNSLIGDVNVLSSEQATIGSLNSSSLNINTASISNVSSDALTSGSVQINTFVVNNGALENLNASSPSSGNNITSNFKATNSSISSLSGTSITSNNIQINSLKSTFLSTGSILVSNASISNIADNNAKFSLSTFGNSVINVLTAGSLEVGNINFTGTLTQNGGAVNIGGGSGGGGGGGGSGEVLQYTETSSRYIFNTTTSFYTRIDSFGGDTVSSIAKMSNNGLYSAIQSNGIIMINSSNGSVIATMGSTTSGTVSYITQFTSSGAVNWNVTLDGNNNENITMVDTTTDDAVLFAGSYTSTVLNIYSTDGSLLQMTLGNEATGSSTGLVGRINSIGSLEWATRLDGINNESVLTVSKSSVDNGVYYGGVFNSTILNIYTTDDTVIQTTINGMSLNVSQGNTKGFIVKSSSSGQALWSMRIGGADLDDSVVSVVETSNDSGTAFSALYSSSQLIIYATNGATIQATYAGSSTKGSLVGKISSIGALEWGVVVSSSSGSTTVNDISYSLRDSSIYFACQSTSTEVIVYRPNGRVIEKSIKNNFRDAYNLNIGFVGKLNSGGRLVWSARLESIFPTIGNGITLTSTTDGGLLANIVYLSSQLNVYNIHSNVLQVTLGNSSLIGRAASAILKYDSAGTLVYSSRIDGVNSDTATTTLESLDGGLYVSGLSNSTSVNVFSESNVIQTSMLNINLSSGNSFGFIIKYDSQTESSFNYSKVYLYQPLSTELSNVITKTELVYTTTSSYYTRISGIGNETMSSISKMNDNGVYTAVQSNNIISILAPRSDNILATFGNSTSGTASYITQFGASGDMTWSVGFDGINNENITMIDTTTDDAVLFAGSYTSTVLNIYSTNGATLQMTLGNETSGTSVGVVGRIDSLGSLEWTNRLDGIGNEIVSTVSKSDIDNGVYYGGVFSTTGLNIYTTDGNTIQASIGALVGENFVGDLVTSGSSIGVIDNVIRFDGANIEQINAVSSAPDNNVYAGGHYTSTQLNIFATNDTTIQHTLTQINNNGTNVGFISRFNSSGGLQWTVRFDGVGSDQVYTVSSAPDNGVYTGGFYTSTQLNIFATNNIIVQRTLSQINNLGTNVGFISRFNSSGSNLWNVRFDGTNSDFVYSVSSAPDNGVYASGFYQSTQLNIFSTNDIGIQHTLSAINTANNGFISRFDSSGGLQWVVRFDGTNSDQVNSVSSASDNGVYAGGMYTSTVLNIFTTNNIGIQRTISGINSDNFNGFISRFNSSGALQWAVRFDGSGGDRVYSVSSTPDNGVYVGGWYTSAQLNIFATNDTTIQRTLAQINNNGTNVGFISRLNSSGALQWAVRFDGVGNDFVYSVSAVSDNSVYVGGYYTSTQLNIFATNDTTIQRTLGNVNTNNESFTARFNSSGTLLQAYRIGGVTSEFIQDGNGSGQNICSHSLGFYASGFSNSTRVEFYDNSGVITRTIGNTNTNNAGFMARYTDKTSGIYVLRSPQPTKGFIVKSSSSGHSLWTMRIGGHDFNDAVTSLVETSADSGLVFGVSYSSTQLAIYATNGTTIQYTYSGTSTQGSLIGKASSTGVLEWGVIINSSLGSTTINDVSYSANDAAICFAGQSSSFELAVISTNGTTLQTSVKKAPEYRDIGFVGKLASTGRLLWMSKIEGSLPQDFGKISTTMDGSVLLAGSFSSNTLAIYATNGHSIQKIIENDTTNGNSASVLLRYSSTGALLSGVKIDGLGTEIATGVLDSGDGGVYISGSGTSDIVNIYDDVYEILDTMGNTHTGTQMAYYIKYESTNFTTTTRNNVTIPVTNYSASLNIGTTIGNHALLVQTVGDRTTDGTFDYTPSAFYNKFDGTGNQTISSLSGLTNSDIYAAMQSDSQFFGYSKNSTIANKTINNMSNIVRIDNTSGDIVWNVGFDGLGVDLITLVDTTTDNAVLFGGSYTSTALNIFDTVGAIVATLGNETIGTSVGLVGKIGSLGNLDWTTRIDGIDNERVSAVSKSSIDNGVYYGGVFNSTVLNIYATNGSAIQSSINGLTGLNITLITGIDHVIRFDGVSSDQLNAVSSSPDNGVYTGGFYSNTQLNIFATNDTTIQRTLSGINTAPYGFISRFSISGALQWTVRFVGAIDNFIYSVSSAPDNGVYSGGFYRSTQLSIFTTDDTIIQRTLSAINTNNNGFISRFNSSGALQWAVRFDGTGSDQINAVSSAPNNGVYTGGYYSSTQLNIFATNDTTIQYTLSGNGSIAGYISRFNSSGTLQWSVRFDNGGSDQVNTVSSAPDNGVYAGGHYDSIRLTIFATNDTTVQRTLSNIVNGVNTGFISRFDSSGALQWAVRFDGINDANGNDFIYSVSSAPDNGVYAGGFYGSGPLNIFATNDTTIQRTLSAFNRNNAGFISRFNSSGALQWAVRFDGLIDDRVYSVSSAPDNGVYAGGFYSSTQLNIFTTNDTTIQRTLGNINTNFEAFATRFNSSGTLLQAYRIGGVNSELIQDSDSLGSGQNICSHVFGFYASGFSNSTRVEFYDNSGVITRSIGNTNTNNTGFMVRYTDITGNAIIQNISQGSAKGFIVKSNSVGQAIWSMRVGGVNMDDLVTSITETPNNNGVAFGAIYNSTQLQIYATNGTAIQNSYSLLSSQGSFIGKVSSAGALEWGVRLNAIGSTTLSDISYSVRDSSIYFAGVSFSTQLSIFSTNGTTIQGTIASSVPTIGSINIGYIGKLNSSGALAWTSKIEGVLSSQFGSITSTTDGGVLLTGSYTSSQVNIFNTSGSIIQKSIFNDSSNASSIFLKFSSTGQLLFDGRIDGEGDEKLTSQIELQNGNICIAGMTTSTDANLYGEYDVLNAVIPVQFQTSGTSMAYTIRYLPVEISNGGTLQYRTDGNLRVSGTTIISGNLMVSGTKNFEIVHPVPEKAAQGLNLRHSALETPTNGDNMYRYVITTVNGYAEIHLPDYFGYLNGNIQTMCSGVDNFGDSYGEYNSERNVVQIYSNIDGKYNVIIIGTRQV